MLHVPPRCSEAAALTRRGTPPHPPQTWRGGDYEAMDRYFFSYTPTVLIFWPCAFTPLAVIVRVLPSFDTTLVAV